ncbi:MAG: ABC transporter permease [Dehalococcoidia bacterium]|nr:ABC transporter permease [Dehalococcoidia bacterium]
MHATRIIMQKELRDAFESKWLISFALTFALLALVLSFVQGSSGDASDQGFNRTTASLVNLCLMLVPLLALVLGAGAIAGEREKGTLATLLCQPVTAIELFMGKYLGLMFAIWLAIALGFGGAGLLVALFNPLTDIGHYALFIGLSAVLASSMLSIGMLISVTSKGRVRALALAVMAWFALVLFYDLGAVSIALWVSSSGRTLTLAALGNPVEAVRLLAVMSLEPDLQVLGPLGAYLDNELGRAVSMGLLSVGIAIWTAGPIVAAAALFNRQDA